MLTDVCAAIHDRLALVAGISAAPDEPPAMVANDRTLLVYPTGDGTSTPQAHRGRDGGLLMLSRDSVTVEWLLKIARDEIERAVRETTPMHDALILECWRAGAREKFGGTITQLHSVSVTGYGPFETRETETLFGVQLTLDVSHHWEVGAG